MMDSYACKIEDCKLFQSLFYNKWSPSLSGSEIIKYPENIVIAILASAHNKNILYKENTQFILFPIKIFSDNILFD